MTSKKDRNVRFDETNESRYRDGPLATTPSDHPCVALNSTDRICQRERTTSRVWRSAIWSPRVSVVSSWAVCSWYYSHPHGLPQHRDRLGVDLRGDPHGHRVIARITRSQGDRVRELARGQHRIVDDHREPRDQELNVNVVVAQACYVAEDLYGDEMAGLTHGGAIEAAAVLGGRPELVRYDQLDAPRIHRASDLRPRAAHEILSRRSCATSARSLTRVGTARHSV